MTQSVTDALTQLAALSARIGADKLLVQGGGGNTSFKCDNALWVKASGTWLAHARERDIFVQLPLEQVRAALHHVDAEAQIVGLSAVGGLRPSIETSLHALLPQAVVTHVHSVNAIAWSVRANAAVELESRLAGMRWAWVPYRRPGHPLTQAVAEVLAAHSEAPDVLVLANHGLIVAADNCGSVEALLQETEHRLAISARLNTPPDSARLQFVNDLDWRVANSDTVHSIGTDPITLEVARTGALYPDHVVFLGAHAPVIAPGATISQTFANLSRGIGTAPVYAVVPDGGVLLAPDISAGAQAMLECLALVGSRLPGARGLRFLSAQDVAALTDWEAEAYRRARDQGHAQA